MMGDTVNVVARLEHKPNNTEYTYLSAKKFMRLPMMNLHLDFLIFWVKGKEIPTKTYELIDKKESINKRSIELIKTFEEGLDNYFNQKWDMYH